MRRAEGPCHRIAKPLGGARCAGKLLTQTNALSFTLRVKGQASHHRMPFYLLGKQGTIESVIRSAAIDNDEGAVARTAESKPHYYSVAVPMTEIWPDYVGSPRDGLRVEIFETWLAEL
jgi:hypothetical protein